MTTNFYFDLFARFIIGIAQVFPAIYMPLWVDVFAHNTEKSSWLTILVLGCPFGLVIGYEVTSLFTAHFNFGWYYSF